MLMIKELSGIEIGNWIVKYVYFFVYCTTKLDYYILDAPVSNRLIEQGVSECLIFSIVVEHRYHSQVFKQDAAFIL